MTRVNIFQKNLWEAKTWEKALRPKLEELLKEKALKVLGTQLRKVGYGENREFQ